MEKSDDRVLFLREPGTGSIHQYEIPIRFLRAGSRFQILARKDSLPGWAEALQTTPVVVWRARNREYTGRAVAIDGADTGEVLRHFEAEFGADRVRDWFGPSVQAFELRPLASGRASYREIVESYFDAIASSYESSVTSNPFDADLRRTSLDVFLRIFRPGDRILEIGAGPGLETLVLASRGIEVVATDISAQMIRRLKAEIELEGLRELVTARKLAAAKAGVARRIRPEFVRRRVLDLRCPQLRGGPRVVSSCPRRPSAAEQFGRVRHLEPSLPRGVRIILSGERSEAGFRAPAKPSAAGPLSVRDSCLRVLFPIVRSTIPASFSSGTCRRRPGVCPSVRLSSDVLAPTRVHPSPSATGEGVRKPISIHSIR